jgi:hypothetical protein
MSIKKSVLQQEDFDRGLGKRLRSVLRAMREEKKEYGLFLKSLLPVNKRVRPPRNRTPQIVKTWTKPEDRSFKKGHTLPVTALVEVKGSKKLVIPDPIEVKARPTTRKVPPPLPVGELMGVPKLQRQAILSRELGVPVKDLFETLLKKRPLLRSDSLSDDPRPHEVLFWGFKNQKLVGPFTTRKEAATQASLNYAMTVDRHWEIKDLYHGKVPHPLLALGYEKWMLLQLPLSTDPDSPCLWQAGVAMSMDEEAGEILADFARQICFKFGIEGTMELPIRNGNKISLAVVEGDNQGFKPGQKLRELPLGQRLQQKLGVTLIDGDNLEKRAKMFLRSYDADGEIPASQVQVILLDKIPWPVKEITDAMIEKEAHVHKRTILKIQQQFWKMGYRWWRDSVTKRKRFNTALDGVILCSSTLKEHSIERMIEKQQELGIDPLLIRKCKRTHQMSFRGLLPGSGQLKGMAQVVEWLPYGYILTHSCNIKREIQVARTLPDGSPVPFRYFWDAFEGKPCSRTNKQYLEANKFLFPDPSLERWFTRMEEKHRTKLREKGIVDDPEELLTHLYSSDENDWNALERGFNTSVRMMATELDLLGFDVREFPKIGAAAATASTRSWVKKDTNQLRIEIPGSCHYQLLPLLVVLLMDPEAPMIDNPNKGIRFHTKYRIAYQHDSLYEKAMIDHGGADGDDFYDFIVREWKGKRVVFRLRSPSRPSEWGMDELEGHPPVDVREGDIEVLSKNQCIAILQEWEKRAHLLPPVPKLQFPKKTQDKKRTFPVKLQAPLVERSSPYRWNRLLDNLQMTSMHAGLLVNLLSLTWSDRDWYLKNAPCGMEEVIDACTKDAAKHGEEGLQWMQSTIVGWWIEWFLERVRMAGGKVAETGLDFTLFYRKGAVGVLRKAGHKHLASRVEELAGLNPRPDHYHSTNLLERMYQRLVKFQDSLKQEAVENFLTLSTRPFLDNVNSLGIHMPHHTFLTLYSKYAACHWQERAYGKKLQGYLQEALAECDIPVLDPPYTNSSVFEQALSKDRKWVNWKWKSKKIKDGLDSSNGRVPLAQKVYRKGLSLIAHKVVESRPGLRSGEFFATCLKLCLSTYSWEGTEGLRIEDFLIDSEDTWARFVTWLLLEWEEKSVLRSHQLKEIEMKTTTKNNTWSRPRTYIFRFITEVYGCEALRTIYNRKPSIGSFEELVKTCTAALSWMKEDPCRSVTVENEAKQIVSIEELIKKLS